MNEIFVRLLASLTTSFSLPRAREARAATRPIPPELQPASSSRRSVSAVAPTPYLAELPRRRHLTIAADLTGGRSIVPPPRVARSAPRAANARPDDGAKGLAFTYFIVNTREAREF